MSADAHLMMRRRVRERARRVWQEGVAGDASLRRLFEEAARRLESSVRGNPVQEMASVRDIDTCT
jgi:hypothetical protein